jgi:outer membrane murein-binding lipoprotein Lpp
MYINEDIYTQSVSPTNDINPKSLGAMWINYTNGKHYICSNITPDNNVWLDPIGQLTTDFNSIIERLTKEFNGKIDTVNSNITKLTNDTNTRINSVNTRINTINSNINKLTTDMNTNVNNINTRIDGIGTNITNMNNDLNKKINTTNSNVTKLNNDMTNNINTINGKINTINTNINNLNTSLTNNVNTINGKITKLTTDTNNSITAINNAISDINKRIDGMNQDKWKDLGNVTGNYSLNLGGANNEFNNFWLTLTGTTKFTTVVTTGAKERSGLIVVKSGGEHLQQMFTNAYWSFTVPILSAPNSSNNGSYLVFPYKLMPTGLVIITRC